MKTLYLVRHAKSSWNQNNVLDFDRPLNERGKNDVKVMAKRLKKREVKVGRILASSSKRTSSTTFGLNRTFELGSSHMEFRQDLYHANVSVLLHRICQTQDDCDELMLVGHNPGVSELCDYLTDIEFIFPLWPLPRFCLRQIVGEKFLKERGRWNGTISLKIR